MMQMVKLFLNPLLVLIFSYNCNQVHNLEINKAHNFDCNKVHKEYFLLDNYCERVDFLEKNYGNVANHCLNKVFIDLYDKSFISPSIQFGHGGLYYGKKEDFEKDIASWRKHFKCSGK